MAWIDVIPEADATGDLRAAYDAIARQRGKLSNILSVGVWGRGRAGA
jgi:hypothetical protein